MVAIRSFSVPVGRGAALKKVQCEARHKRGTQRRPSVIRVLCLVFASFLASPLLTALRGWLLAAPSGQRLSRVMRA